MKDALADRPLEPATVGGLLLVFALIGAPHLWHLSPLLMSVFYAALAWRGVSLIHPRLLPGRRLRGLLALAALVAVLWSVSGQLDGRALGVGLLTVMAGLKSLEVSSRRDLYVTVFLGCFLLATQFLFDQGLWISLYLAPLLVVLLGLLVRNNRVNPPPWPRALREAGWLMVAGLPMALLLFVLFSRLAGPLWALTAPAPGVTGMTDRLSPGSVSQLSQSGAVAFRVSFTGPRPPQAELYWRGPVFWDTDGRTWRAGVPLESVSRAGGVGAVWSQQVTLEPSNQRWLFALDRPLQAPPQARLSGDGQLLSAEPINTRRHYRVRSQAGVGEVRLAAADRRRALAVPESVVTARMRALVAEWRQADPRPGALVAAALRHFRHQPFVYTLRPPALPDNPVDGFLFETKRGFCEHYATSFAVLMRLAGVPTRLVGGYQGGEWNPVGEHMIVRQSDAHAWAEVWLGDRWQRVDPTAAVAPDRVEQSIDPTATTSGPMVYQGPPPSWLARLWRDGGWFVDGLALSWQRWVVGYSDRTQAGLLERLGLGWLSGYRLALAAVAAAGLGMLPLWWLLRRGEAVTPDPAQRVWQRLLVRLRAAGVDLSPNLSPSDVGRRAAARFPAQRAAIERIVGLYLAQRYGHAASSVGLRRLRAAVRRLRLRR